MADTRNNTLRQVQDGDDSQKDLFLTFHVNGENYGLEIGQVVEIVGSQNITAVPDLPDYLKGVVNMRGLVLPVMDVRLRFGMSERDFDNRTCLIFVCVENNTVGLLVDRVNDVVAIPITQIEPAPAVRDGQPRYLKGMGKVGNSVNLLINTKELLTFGRLAAAGEGVAE